MSLPDTIKKFLKWIQVFDYRLLNTKDDVEKKFILPLFQHLDYPEKYGCSKYALDTDNSGNSREKLENALIYFSTEDVTKQNADTSLIIVIYLELNATNFPEAIKQAKFYSLYLKPLFIFITNGYQIQIFKYFAYHQEDLIFDINIDLLKNSVTASKFYDILNFYCVKSIDKNRTNILPHSQFSLIKKSLRQHPDLQEIIAKADFEPSIIRQGNRLIVVKPKVVIECNLPQVFGEGDCQIQFSSLILRGLKIKLNHQSILDNFITGLHTQPSWGCRRFLKQLDKDIFEIYLGQTTIVLSELEATDLCLCIDAVFQEYKNLIVEFENILETWDFKFVEFLGVRGFCILSIDFQIWELMQNFAHEFDYTKGKSQWHLFHQQDTAIRISRGISDHAFIVPQPVNYGSLLPNSVINILYEINEIHLQSLERGEVNYWKQDIGIQGTWTARYTKQWLLDKYIPQVIDYYSQNYQFPQAKNERVSLLEIDYITQLLPYLQDIQSWLSNYIENIVASLLQAYYQAFTDLVINTDSSIIGIDYIAINLYRVKWHNTQKEINSNFLDWNFKDVIYCLDAQVTRINNCKYENSFKADLITRTFIWIIEHGKIRFSQSQLNAAKQALLPLWEQCRFEMRYVYANKAI